MKRLLTAAWLVPFGALSIFWAPRPVFVVIVSCLALLCYREFIRMVENQGLKSFAFIGSVFGVLLLVAPQLQWPDFLLLSLLGLGFSLRVDDFRIGFASAAAFVLGILYVFGAWRAGIALHDRNLHWLFFAVALNWAGDVSAYYVGRAFGRHKLAPVVSPGKSVEGALASVAASVLFGCVYLPYFVPDVTLLQAALFAVVGNVAGQFGDLSESALKRGAQMKDSGTMLAGHGGWLDRLDSSLFSMPAVYWLLAAWQPLP